MTNLTDVFNRMGLLDLIFLIPMFMLFSYLPSYNFVSILLNIIIVIFFTFGLAMAFHIIVDLIKKRNRHRT
ncbi:membrane protein [Oceanobacillus picturae]|uniref:Membrane protein n=1 Tax=Oceanobacillus picturae TaxID=171693 RepID=A0A0U9H4Q8_9BACI|nr:DUF6007 family protein [Oceanobacillus picturae]GAQ17603.1 membrane protein [Oceanobacillus picturae]